MEYRVTITELPETNDRGRDAADRAIVWAGQAADERDAQEEAWREFAAKYGKDERPAANVDVVALD